eukprot:scaffold1066_cov115-Isochrysis_galbana.AAC.7
MVPTATKSAGTRAVPRSPTVWAAAAAATAVVAPLGAKRIAGPGGAESPRANAASPTPNSPAAQLNMPSSARAVLIAPNTAGPPTTWLGARFLRIDCDLVFFSSEIWRSFRLRSGLTGMFNCVFSIRLRFLGFDMRSWVCNVPPGKGDDKDVTVDMAEYTHHPPPGLDAMIFLGFFEPSINARYNPNQAGSKKFLRHYENKDIALLFCFFAAHIMSPLYKTRSQAANYTFFLHSLPALTLTRETPTLHTCHTRHPQHALAAPPTLRSPVEPCRASQASDEPPDGDGAATLANAASYTSSGWERQHIYVPRGAAVP